tara:strand:+ start:116 stop:226 length:111 start_codon:yes stop_codon:yes gene_type:complete
LDIDKKVVKQRLELEKQRLEIEKQNKKITELINGRR